MDLFKCNQTFRNPTSWQGSASSGLQYTCRKQLKYYLSNYSLECLDTPGFLIYNRFWWRVSCPLALSRDIIMRYYHDKHSLKQPRRFCGGIKIANECDSQEFWQLTSSDVWILEKWSHNHPSGKSCWTSDGGCLYFIHSSNYLIHQKVA